MTQPASRHQVAIKQ
uniref:Uncharacterized protein n=1 Tax=Arundo donax TaxID=35708 RepID=A0A0A9ANV1_ARUDO